MTTNDVYVGYSGGPHEWPEVHHHEGRQGGHPLLQHQVCLLPAVKERDDCTPPLPSQGEGQRSEYVYSITPWLEYRSNSDVLYIHSSLICIKYVYIAYAYDSL